MAFTLPDFNITVQVWTAPNRPNLGPFDFTTPAQLYIHTKLSELVDPTGGSQSFQQAFLRVPWNPGQWKVDNVALIPVTVSSYVLVTYGYVVHLGFPNEYLQLSILQCDAAGNFLPWQTF